jgi:hypothetical protein
MFANLIAVSLTPNIVAAKPVRATETAPMAQFWMCTHFVVKKNSLDCSRKHVVSTPSTSWFSTAAGRGIALIYLHMMHVVLNINGGSTFTAKNCNSLVGGLTQ